MEDYGMFWILTVARLERLGARHCRDCVSPPNEKRRGKTPLHVRRDLSRMPGRSHRVFH